MAARKTTPITKDQQDILREFQNKHPGALSPDTKKRLAEENHLKVDQVTRYLTSLRKATAERERAEQPRMALVRADARPVPDAAAPPRKADEHKRKAEERPSSDRVPKLAHMAKQFAPSSARSPRSEEEEEEQEEEDEQEEEQETAWRPHSWVDGDRLYFVFHKIMGATITTAATPDGHGVEMTAEYPALNPRDLPVDAPVSELPPCVGVYPTKKKIAPGARWAAPLANPNLFMVSFRIVDGKQ